MSRIHLASDHAGFPLKEELARRLAAQGHDIVDDGTHDTQSCDYPVHAHRLCEAVEAEGSLGVLICGTGLGMSMAANRHAGIRAALCTTELHARMSRRHNDANVLCLGARVTGQELAFAIADVFFSTDFEGGRHQRRLDLLLPQA